MNTPWMATRRLDDKAWRALKVRAIFQCCKWDLNREDHSVVAPYALILDREHWVTVAEIARRLAKEALLLEYALLVRI